MLEDVNWESTGIPVFWRSLSQAVLELGAGTGWPGALCVFCLAERRGSVNLGAASPGGEQVSIHIEE